MSSSQNVWVYPENNPVLLEQIIREFHIHPVTAQIFVSRGFTNLEDIHSFLYAKLPQLYSPHLLPHMNQAVERILTARKKRERVLIYADNDVDGMTGGALLQEFLEKISVPVLCYIPKTTYGDKNFAKDAFTYAKENGCSLLITVDCSIDPKQRLSKGSNPIDLIITDHHEPTKKPSHKVATLNPKLIGSQYPNRDLTGVGVAFKLAHAILNAIIDQGELLAQRIDLKDFLDLVALGTIADMGALLGENRILVRYGLQILQKNQRVGLKKLFQLCGLDVGEISPIDIALKVAPRLNSLGRIADPQKGVELLLTKEEKTADRLATELNKYNAERQKIEKKIADDVDSILKNHPEETKERAIVLYSDRWHPGIVPIIASKISRHYHCPAMIIAVEEAFGKGSVRTIPYFPLISILKKQRDLLENFGGHDYAAGLTIKKERIEELKKRFVEAANQQLKEGDMMKKLKLDARIGFQDLTFHLMESLKLLEPFGNENPAPLLYADVKQYRKAKLVGQSHVKMYLKQEMHLIEGIGFSMADKKETLQQKEELFRVVFTPVVKNFHNKATIQLHVRDF